MIVNDSEGKKKFNIKKAIEYLCNFEFDIFPSDFSGSITKIDYGSSKHIFTNKYLGSWDSIDTVSFTT